MTVKYIVPDRTQTPMYEHIVTQSPHAHTLFTQTTWLAN